MEGGIRVPAFFQWIGTIPQGATTNTWGGNTDILPTILDAAGIKRHPDIKLDGVSLMPTLLKALSHKSDQHHKHHKHHHKALNDSSLQVRSISALNPEGI